MAKTLPVLGIVGSVMAGLALLALSNLALLLVPLFALVAAGFLFRERNAMATGIAVVAILASIASILGDLHSVSYKQSGIEFGISVEVGTLLAVVAALLVPTSVVLLRRGDIEPEWLAFLGLGCAALSFVVACLGLSTLGDHGNVLTLVAGLLAFASMAPSISAMRNSA